MSRISSTHSDLEILQEIGRRLRAYRLQQNVPIESLARDAGLSRNTVGNAENGRDPRLSTLVRILRALSKLEALDGFLPSPTVSPMQLLETRGKPRRRARRRS